MAKYLKWENSFKPKVAIANFIGKMQEKSGIMKSGLDTMALFLQDDLLTFSNILIGNHVHGPLPTKQNLDHGFGKLQSVFHCYFHIRNVNEDVRFETPLFQRCLEFI